MLIDRMVGISLAYAYLNCHAIFWFCLWWFSLLLINLCQVAICLFFCRQWLVITGYLYYYCLSNNQRWLCTKVEGADGLPLGWSFDRDRWLLWAYTYIYLLYLKCEDAILAISVHGSTYHYLYCWSMVKKFNIPWWY